MSIKPISFALPSGSKMFIIFYLHYDVFEIWVTKPPPSIGSNKDYDGYVIKENRGGGCIIIYIFRNQYN